MDKLITGMAQLRRTDVPNLPKDPITQNTADDVRGVALAIFGGVALIIMAYAGFKYVMSRGNPEETAKAQKTIIYALVGLIVAIFVITLISFVLNRI